MVSIIYIFITVLGPRGKTYWSQRQIVFFLWKQEVPKWLCSCRWLPVFWVWITPKHSHFPRRVQRCTRIAKTPCEYWGRIEIFYWHSWSRQWRSICYRSKIRARHVKRTLKIDQHKVFWDFYWSCENLQLKGDYCFYLFIKYSLRNKGCNDWKNLLHGFNLLT